MTRLFFGSAVHGNRTTIRSSDQKVGTQSGGGPALDRLSTECLRAAMADPLRPRVPSPPPPGSFDASEASEASKRVEASEASDVQDLPMEVAVHQRMRGASKRERDIVQHHLGRLNGRDAAESTTWLRTYLAVPTAPATTKPMSREDAVKTLDDLILGQQEAKKALLGEFNYAQVSGRDRFVTTLVGPPGVGKTVLVKALGAVFGRPVIHISVDALSDARSLMGYETTFKGLVPGALLDELNACECTNPIIFFDEFDKAKSEDLRDLLNQLLDAKRPWFKSAYLGYTLDLSRVAFIMAVNDLSRVESSPSLLSRLGPAVDMPGYGREDKARIVKEWIIRDFNATLPTARRLVWPDSVVGALLDFHDQRYPLDASGVRELDTWVGAASKECMLLGDTELTTEHVRGALSRLHNVLQAEADHDQA